jgi:signal peptide peptidase SppA
MKTFRHTANIVHGTPWMIERRALDFIASVLERHLAGENIPKIGAEKIGTTNDWGQINKADGGPGYDLSNGVATIPIMGPIVPRAGMMGNVSQLAWSSEKIAASATHAADNPDVKCILLDIDSPGGSVIGGFEAADALYAARQKKPMAASINGMGCSLAYLFASQAEKVFASRGSVVGSIGVIASLPLSDRAERNAGVDRITVASSRSKAMSGMTEDEIRAQLAAEVEKYFGMFKASIANARPQMNLDSTATGETWLADEADDLGLVDDIATLDQVRSQLEKMS